MNETISRQGGAAAPPSQHRPRLRTSGVALSSGIRVLKDRYVLESRLGGSGTAEIFKAADRFEHDAARRSIAIKIVGDEGGSRSERLSNLRREFHRTQSLCHESIVKVYDLDRADGVAFFTMEFVEGRLLSEAIKLYSPRHIPRPDAWRIIEGLAAGLAHAHSRMVVHGGLKPQSIVVPRAGGVRILDFSASRSCGGLRSRVEAAEAGAALTTRGYSCWEVLDGRPADPRDDVYSLACVSYELLAGAHPFLRRQPDRAGHRRMRPERPAGLSLRQWQTLQAGLCGDRESRPLSVAEWFSHLDPSQTRRSGLRSRPSMAVERTRQTRALPSFIVVPVVALLALLSLLSSIQGGPPRARAPAPTPLALQASKPIVARIRPDPGSDSALPAAAQAGADAGASAASPASFRTFASVPAHRPGVEEASAKIGGIFLPRLSYRVRPRQDFVEIRVRRPPGSLGTGRFSWWTEAASAKSGSDFVPQNTVTRFFPKGEQAASVFVKVLPGKSRAQPETFYVDVAGSNGGGQAPRVERVAVVLPGAR